MIRDHDDDLQALRRALPVPAERDFPAGRRHQREEHLMTSWLDMSHGAPERGRLAVRVGVPVAVAAAAVAAVVAVSTTGTGSPAPGGHPSAVHEPAARVPARAGASSSTGPLGITTAAYTLTRQQPGDRVRITLHPSAAGEVDPAQLQRDLASLGIHAKVTRGEPRTYPRVYNLAERAANGDYVATVLPELTGRFPEVIVFSENSPASDVLTVSVAATAG
ncbi:hypothetical protein [Actinacidiphila acidipaludis]|uniref:LytR/CpsA/Psr regulator C-terminal domain-containing protein n=1 Tax=Actinacidiphila acidipaludis TaxID=2873382 RepID=A0ABS7PZ05_9ACTN|nr:hypothetical protein [Streptomyces acidipaludis]MBY8876125.1 hypothetical protein [Streptomyces acidipaludis]